MKPEHKAESIFRDIKKESFEYQNLVLKALYEKIKNQRQDIRSKNGELLSVLDAFNNITLLDNAEAMQSR